MSKVPFILTSQSVTFTLDGKPHQVSRNSVTFSDVINELRQVDPNEARLIELARPIIKIEREITRAFTDAPLTQNYLAKRTVEVTRNGVLLDGQVMHGVLVDRMMEMLALGLPLGGMIRFMENLYMNPAAFARAELYLWLEGTDLPITEDGHFLAYKYVNENFRDCYSGKFDNSPGQIVQMKGRHEVDPVRDHTCSTGLHFCSKSYIGYAGGPKFVLLKINPADVVSIPSDYDNAKGRTWRYEVLREVFKEEIDKGEWAPLVASDGSDYSEFGEDGILRYSIDNVADVNIETDEDGEFYVYVTNGYDENDVFVRGTLADAKSKAYELAYALEIEDDDLDDEDEPVVTYSLTTAEGYQAEISGPDDEGDYYWQVRSGDYNGTDRDGYADSYGMAHDAVADASKELAGRADTELPVIGWHGPVEPDPELEALLAEEEEIQRIHRPFQF